MTALLEYIIVVKGIVQIPDRTSRFYLNVIPELGTRITNQCSNRHAELLTGCQNSACPTSESFIITEAAASVASMVTTPL